MKTVTIEMYHCEICGAEYSNAVDCLENEKIPISHDKGVKVGDKINIITGEGRGLGEVSSIFIVQCNNQYGYPKEYWHSVALIAECKQAFGSRSLCFNDYEVIK